MASKKLITLLMITLAFMMLVGTVNAADTITSITLVTPATSAVLQGSTLLNATMVGGTSNQSLYNLTYQAYSADSANSSYVTICTSVNVNTTTLASLDSALNCSGFNNTDYTVGDKTVYNIQDDDSYNVRVIIVQGNDSTNTKTATAKTGITFDYGVPTQPTSVQPATGTVYDDGQDTIRINATITGSGTTLCTLTWSDKTPTGTRTSTMTESGNTCYLSLTNVPDGTYEYTIIASDGTNTSTSAEYSVIFDNREASPGAKAYVTGMVGSEAGGGDVIAVVLLVVIIGYVIINKNK